MTLLPPALDTDRYFSDLHGQPLGYWQGALTALAARHDVPDGPWEEPPWAATSSSLGLRW